MSQQLMNRDLGLVRGAIGKEFGDRIVQLELSLGRQVDNSCGCELLGNGTQAKDRVAGKRPVILPVGHAVSLRDDNFAILGHKEQAGESLRG